MKTKSLFFAALLLVSAVASAAGIDEPRNTGMVVVPVKGSEVFKVIYKGETSGKVKLNIYDASAALILSQTFNSVDGFICPLNFSGLAPGEYTIEIVSATGKHVEKVNYASRKSSAFVHVSKIQDEEGKYLLSVANAGTDDQISIRIFDDSDTLIHSETKAVDGDFAQVYSVNGRSASYTFEVSDSTGTIKSIRF